MEWVGFLFSRPVSCFNESFSHPVKTATVSAILAGETEVFAKVRTGVHGDVQDQQTLHEHQDVGVLH